ncbi:MAG: RagB/SusD family nutrient uptake outer membrane protein, partial [Candidatus Cryptobacteroides sp.]
MKKYILPLLTMAIALTSCDFLDRTPKDKLAPENYFRNEQDFKLFSNSFYDNLFDKTPYDEQSDVIFLKGTLSDELLGSVARVVPTAAGTGGWSWTQLRKINTMLGNMDKCDDPDVVKEYTALAKFFRACFYYEKVKRFGDVPWYDRELGSTDEDLYKPRDSREVIMAHMIEDIDEAIEGLPSEVSTYRVNRWAALMLKAQFCLFEGTFRKYHQLSIEGGRTAEEYLRLAAAAAAEVFENGPYSLAPDYGELFREPDADPREYILAIKMEQSISCVHNATGYSLMESPGCPGFSKKFIDSFLMKDGSRFTDKEGWETMLFVDQMKNRDPRLGMITRLPSHVRTNSKKTVKGPEISLTATGYQFDKFVMSPEYEIAERANMSFNDIPVYRLGEAYLIYAEAKAELNEFTQADADKSINQLRKRAGMPDMNVGTLTVDPFLISETYGYTHLASVAPSNMAQILEIRRERTIELVLEASKRWEDIIRWKEGHCYEQPLTGMYFPGPGEYDLTGDGEADICLYKTSDKPTGYPEEFTLIQIQEIEIDGKYVPYSNGIVL